MRDSVLHLSFLLLLPALLLGPAHLCRAQERGALSARASAEGTGRRPGGIRTNLCLPLLNAGLSFPVGRKASAGLDVYFPWFSPGMLQDGRCAELLAVRLECRRWLRPDGAAAATGPFAGVSAVGACFDFGGTAEGRRGELAGGSLDFGWAWTVGRRGLRLGLCVGAGAACCRYRSYMTGFSGRLVDRDGSVSRRLWTGPTRLDLTLEIPIRI